MSFFKKLVNIIYMILILKSLGIVLSISTLLATTSYYMFNISFTGVFITGTVLQLVCSYFINSWIEARTINESANRDADLIKEFNKQGTEVPCAYCGEVNYIPIRTDLPNDFTCGKCGKENAVYISITAAHKTNPLQSSPLEVLSYNTQLEAAKEQILEDTSDE
mgnify:CR=1 FL=1